MDVNSVAWSQHGDRIASGADDSTVRIWDASSGKLLRTLEEHIKEVYSVAWNPQGDRIASGDYGGDVRIWDAETGELLRSQETFEGFISSVAWSPQGDRIVSATANDTVRIWDATTGELLRILEGYMDWAFSVVWSPNGDRIACGHSISGSVSIWSTKAVNLLATFLALDEGDWITYIPSGYFIGSPGIEEYFLMGMREGQRVYSRDILPIDNPNPKKVREALAGAGKKSQRGPRPPSGSKTPIGPGASKKSFLLAGQDK